MSAPLGNTTLSGQVITLDGAPVAAACIFVLAPAQVYSTVADADGQWTLGSLSDTSSFAVAAVTPFDGTFGPCANDGPPPIPEPGALQPEFHDNIWIDLSDPDLVGGSGDPFTYAIARGATAITGSRAGIVSCLTSTPADVVPRPPCFAPTTTTTTSTTTVPPSTTVAIPGAANPPTLAVTGPRLAGGIATAAMALIALGGVTLVGARRRATAH